MGITHTHDSIGNLHAHLAAVASAMGPAWSVGEEGGMHHLTDGCVLLGVSWHTQNQRLRFRGSYGQHRIVDTTAALTREPAAVARQLLAHHESARLDSAQRAATAATNKVAWRSPRRAAQDLLAPFVAPPHTSMWTCTGLDPDARVAVTAGRVRGTLELNLDSSTCSLKLGHLALPEMLEVLLALDESRLAEALTALLAVPAATNEATRWAAQDLLAPFVAPTYTATGMDPDARVVMVAGRVRGQLELSPDGSNCSLVLGLLALPEALEVLTALDESRLAGALAALLAVPAAGPSTTEAHRTAAPTSGAAGQGTAAGLEALRAVRPSSAGARSWVRAGCPGLASRVGQAALDARDLHTSPVPTRLSL